MIILPLLTALTLAQAQPAAPPIHAGMPAPDFKVERFIKGEPIALAKGRIYVIEFWATWCGPYIMSMPHLSQLQREYKDSVTICGVNVWQDKEYTPATLETVTKFVQKKADAMDYTIAYDGAAKHMDTAWLAAAGQRGIPASFVVDRAGNIAWIGRPDMLDMVLESVSNGTWDPATGPARLDAAAKAFDDAITQYKEGLAAGEAAWQDAVKRFPAMARTRAGQRFGGLLSAGHVNEAAALGSQMIEEARKAKNPAPVMAILESLGNPALLKDPAAKQLLLAAAQANLDQADPAEPGPHVVMARAYYFNNQPEKARAAAAKALELAPQANRAALERWLKDIEESAKKK